MQRHFYLVSLKPKFAIPGRRKSPTFDIDFQIIITLGANKDAKDMDGWTPLHVATYYDNYGVMSILLEAGADVFALDCDLNYPINHIMNGL